MKKIALVFFFATSLFAGDITLENQTSYPSQNAVVAVQWASTAREVQEHNEILIRGEKVSPSTLQYLDQAFKTKLSIPKTAEYFRVLVWPKGSGSPELLTNWVEIIPNKTYLLKKDHLTPVLLMVGMGC
jgi:hypothetical protein